MILFAKNWVVSIWYILSQFNYVISFEAIIMIILANIYLIWIVMDNTSKEPCHCLKCYKDFDIENHVPLLLPACGHSFCQMCISDEINKKPNDDILCFSCLYYSFK